MPDFLPQLRELKTEGQIEAFSSFSMASTHSGRLIKCSPCQFDEPTTPPITLHWILTPFSAGTSRGVVYLDLARDISARVLHESLLYGSDGPGGGRPLTADELKEPVAEPTLTNMVIRCARLPDHPVRVARQSGIRCIDVFKAIRDTYRANTAFDFSVTKHAPYTGVPPTTPLEFLEGDTLFFGIIREQPSVQYPYGYWLLKVGGAPSWLRPAKALFLHRS
ncbi:hypothetical protein BC834DRAFT_844271 [Gloeopeniophorella convolvens]|nr:hypothetical protein BC834DRAFT_844271 [Gloeopeniophorella convolvens]